jgi:hypothetical protein
MTFYVIALSFFQSFKSFCINIYYIHLQFFFTEFFKDNIHSIQYSSAQEKVLQHKFNNHKNKLSTAATPATATAAAPV